MFNETHHLVEEFPEYKEKIHALKTSNPHFARLFAEYERIDHEIHLIEEEIKVASDMQVEDLKKKRLHLKDELFELLQHG